MFPCRSCLRARAWVPFVLLSVLGCESGPQRIDPPELKDDFGGSLEPKPITEESVGETQMLYRRSQFELRGMAVVPTGFFEKNDFDVGVGGGMKAALEMSKNFFLGFSFDYMALEQGKGVADVVNSPNGLLNLRPDQLYDNIERFNFLFVGDYDFTLAKSFIGDKTPLKLRLGGGLGATLIDGDVDSFLEDQIAAAGSTVDTVPYVGFLGRLGIQLRWQLHQNVLLMTGVEYDFVYPFEIEIKVDRQRSTVNGDIDFGSINLGAGIVFEF